MQQKLYSEMNFNETTSACFYTLKLNANKDISKKCSYFVILVTFNASTLNNIYFNFNLKKIVFFLNNKLINLKKKSNFFCNASVDILP